ncbi:DUF6894 family protein [Rhodopseudomonas pseudopalustris]|uniref:DUF6894 domain-containing protein n=2 Tax=Rhodopseudomonas TaxID=1073 RepID=Q133P4_RHOPS|nr:hypothetical protein [Rhodopseudomonas pseudopalustris]ABE40695.1 conserved hypothetical protein [Rhodopseudomonas palustris BisB5]MBB1093792.1 hypothetical protein [Rhodopseudomonas palustris]SEO54768.1 hypothetical protein SAMN05444123_103257 [Rhodopseudomonas pseudopalustris]
MPRYYFNTRIGEELIPDPEGEDLRDADHAWQVARATIKEIIKTEAAQVDLIRASLEVTDEEGDVVLDFPFSEALVDMPALPRNRH